MNKITLITKYKNLEFKIEEDIPEVGVYMHIYENGKDIRDELQNTIHDCKEIAFERYGVPLDSWSKI